MKNTLLFAVMFTFSAKCMADGLIDSAAAVQAAQAACKAISPPFDARIAASIAKAAITRSPDPAGLSAATELVHACVAAANSASAGVQAASMAVETAAASAAILAALAAVAAEKAAEK